MKKSPIQINAKPKEFADLCEERELAEIDQILKMANVFPSLASSAINGLLQLEKRILSIEKFLFNNPLNEIANPDRLNKYKKDHLNYYNKILQIMGDDFITSYEILREQWLFPKFNPDGTHEPLPITSSKS